MTYGAFFFILTGTQVLLPGIGKIPPGPLVHVGTGLTMVLSWMWQHHLSRKEALPCR